MPKIYYCGKCGNTFEPFYDLSGGNLCSDCLGSSEGTRFTGGMRMVDDDPDMSEYQKRDYQSRLRSKYAPQRSEGYRCDYRDCNSLAESEGRYCYTHQREVDREEDEERYEAEQRRKQRERRLKDLLD